MRSRSRFACASRIRFAGLFHNVSRRKLAADGRLYVADEMNHRICAIDLESGVIETVAGTGEAKFSGDGGPAKEASLYRPAGLAFNS